MSRTAATRTRRIGVPRPADVEVSPDGRPAAVGRIRVEAIREDWVVEDRWWSAEPLRRRYFELVLANGRNAVVFHDLSGGAWLAQRD